GCSKARITNEILIWSLLEQAKDRLGPDAEDYGGGGQEGHAGEAGDRESHAGAIAGWNPPHGTDNIEVVVESGGGGDEGHSGSGPEAVFDGDLENEELADEAGGERDTRECGEQGGEGQGKGGIGLAEAVEVGDGF